MTVRPKASINGLPAKVVIEARLGSWRLFQLAVVFLNFIIFVVPTLLLVGWRLGRAALTGVFILLSVPFLMLSVELLVVVIRHQFRLNIGNDLFQIGQKAVEVLFIKENLMPFITIAIETLGAFGERKEEVVALGLAYVEEVGSTFSSVYFFREHAIKPSVSVHW